MTSNESPPEAPPRQQPASLQTAFQIHNAMVSATKAAHDQVLAYALLINNLVLDFENLHETVTAKNNHIATLEKDIETRNTRITALEKENEELRVRMSNLEARAVS
jgi:chromosome segregation ATPase